jgi:hypothetical protein
MTNRKAPQPRQHRLLIDVCLNEGMSTQECADWLEHQLVKFFGPENRSSGKLLRAIHIVDASE